MEYVSASPVIDLMGHATAVTPLPAEKVALDELPEKISAYYSLAFPSFTYYVQTITVSIGRRSVRPGTPSSSEQTQVDVDLGPLKSVSRLHAKIEYEESQERFVLVVLGRNGAWVDGIWSGSGSRVPLGARSQIQIATRVFDFVLPPPPAPEDSPSPSSPSSTTRHLSPSIDITSLSPDSSVHSPLSKPVDLPSDGDDEHRKTGPLVEGVNLSTKPSSKKRKKPGDSRPPPPTVMPPRPQFTYAQLCYRAITALKGKATLQEICNWISDSFDWYRYNEGSGWESSIRHNLSSNRAFKKMERCAGERGKGFFWSVDSRFEHTVKDQEGKTHPSSDKPKVKNPKLLEPPLTRTVKAEIMTPLPPPLLSPRRASVNTSLPPPTSYQFPPAIATKEIQPTRFIIEEPHIKLEKEANALAAKIEPPPPPKFEPVPVAPAQAPLYTPTIAPVSSTSSTSTIPSSLTSDIIPIVIGPVPLSAPSDASSNKPASPLDLSSPPIAFQNDTIILNPTIFSSLTPVHLKELESLGAKKAIEILQTYIVRFLKEKRKAEGSKSKGKKKKDKSKKKEGANKEGTTSATGAAVVNGPGQQAQPTISVPPNSSSANMALDSIPNAVSLSTSPSVLSPTSDMIRAVAPLRLSSPPMASLGLSSNEEIDIMGDFDEPSPKKRKLDAQVGLIEA